MRQQQLGVDRWRQGADGVQQVLERVQVLLVGKGGDDAVDQVGLHQVVSGQRDHVRQLREQVARLVLQRKLIQLR